VEACRHREVGEGDGEKARDVNGGNLEKAGAVAAIVAAGVAVLAAIYGLGRWASNWLAAADHRDGITVEWCDKPILRMIPDSQIEMDGVGVTIFSTYPSIRSMVETCALTVDGTLAHWLSEPFEGISHVGHSSTSYSTHLK
jgi:hypothetical protein